MAKSTVKPPPQHIAAPKPQPQRPGQRKPGSGVPSPWPRPSQGSSSAAPKFVDVTSTRTAPSTKRLLGRRPAR